MLSNIGLITLDNFPKLKSLEIVRKKYNIIKNTQLELNNNKLDGEDFNILIEQTPNLRKIKINNNMISSIESLKNLNGLNLRKLSIIENPIINSNKNYKEELYNFFPTLISINNSDKEENYVESTEYGEGEDFFCLNDSSDEEGEEDGGELEEGGSEDREEDEENEEESDNEENTKKQQTEQNENILIFIILILLIFI